MNHRRHYPDWLRNVLRQSPGELTDTGLSKSTIYRLKKGRTKQPSLSTLDSLYLYHVDYWTERMEKRGIVPEVAQTLIERASFRQIRFEEKQRRDIAEIISRNRDDGQYHPVSRVLEGMAMSTRVDAGDWVKYVKELFNEVPSWATPQMTKGVRSLTRRQRKEYYERKRKMYPRRAKRERKYEH
jgi:transcriptional regulator with XRE-family HTH domain